MSDGDSVVDDNEDILYFILYFVLTCFSVFFLIILVFLCMSGRICVYIYYMVYKLQVCIVNTTEENLIENISASRA